MYSNKHIFFDLDHTLWDFEVNSKETLHNLYEEQNLLAKGIEDFDAFFNYIVKLLNKEIRTQMGNNSYTFLIKEYNIDITYNKIVNKINLWLVKLLDKTSIEYRNQKSDYENLNELIGILNS